MPAASRGAARGPSYCAAPAEPWRRAAHPARAGALWSGGVLAARVELGRIVLRRDDGRAHARIEISIENLGSERIVAPRLLFRLRAFRPSGAPLEPIELTRLVSGRSRTPVVDGGERGSIWLEFTFDAATELEAIDRLVLRWGVTHGDGSRSLDYAAFLRCTAAAGEPDS